MAPASTESPTDMMIALLFYVRGHTKKNGMGCRPNCLHPSRGSINKKKVLQDPGPNTHTAATIRKEVLTPPQKGLPRCGGGGGYGGQNPKNHWGILRGRDPSGW